MESFLLLSLPGVSLWVGSSKAPASLPEAVPVDALSPVAVATVLRLLNESKSPVIYDTGDGLYKAPLVALSVLVNLRLSDPLRLLRRRSIMRMGEDGPMHVLNWPGADVLIRDVLATPMVTEEEVAKIDLDAPIVVRPTLETPVDKFQTMTSHVECTNSHAIMSAMCVAHVSGNYATYWNLGKVMNNQFMPELDTLFCSRNPCECTIPLLSNLKSSGFCKGDQPIVSTDVIGITRRSGTIIVSMYADGVYTIVSTSEDSSGYLTIVRSTKSIMSDETYYMQKGCRAVRGTIPSGEPLFVGGNSIGTMKSNTDRVDFRAFDLKPYGFAPRCFLPADSHIDDVKRQIGQYSIITVKSFGSMIKTGPNPNCRMVDADGHAFIAITRDVPAMYPLILPEPAS